MVENGTGVREFLIYHIMGGGIGRSWDYRKVQDQFHDVDMPPSIDGGYEAIKHHGV